VACSETSEENIGELTQKIRNKWKQMPQTRKAMDTSWTMFLTQIIQLHTTTTQKAHALIIDIGWSMPRLQSTNTISHIIKMQQS
jgi:hypothetical protein